MQYPNCLIQKMFPLFIVDSGSDATVIPSKYVFCGFFSRAFSFSVKHWDLAHDYRSSVRSSGELRDCQGKVINTSGAHEFSFVVDTGLFSVTLGMCQILSRLFCFHLVASFNMDKRLVHMTACRVCTMQTKSWLYRSISNMQV